MTCDGDRTERWNGLSGHESNYTEVAGGVSVAIRSEFKLQCIRIYGSDRAVRFRVGNATVTVPRSHPIRRPARGVTNHGMTLSFARIVVILYFIGLSPAFAKAI